MINASVGLSFILLAVTAFAQAGNAITSLEHEVGLAITTSEFSSRWIASDRVIVFPVGEGDQEPPRDLNGDGDTDDVVPHMYDPEGRVTVNTGVAFKSYSPSEQLLLIYVSEQAHGEKDLNGDGDAEDYVLRIHNLETGRASNTGLAGAYGGKIIFERYLPVVIYESAQGSQDLNGDGDAEDDILHLFDLQTGKVTNTGLAGWVQMAVSRRWLAIGVREKQQNRQNLNGDGDTIDIVLHVYDLDTTQTRNLDYSGGALTPGKELPGHWLPFFANEGGLGRRLRGRDPAPGFQG